MEELTVATLNAYNHIIQKLGDGKWMPILRVNREVKENVNRSHGNTTNMTILTLEDALSSVPTQK